MGALLMSTSYPPHYAYPSAPALQRALPSPPRLHWGWVLALSIITFGIFGSIWLVVQANWIRRMRGASKGFWFAIANLALLPVIFLYGMAVALAARFFPSPSTAALMASLDPLARLTSFVLYVCAVFTMRSEMERAPIEIPLGGVMTFLFGPLYFQYHLRDYAEGNVPEIGLGLSQPTLATVYPTQPMEYPPPPAEPFPPFGPSA